MGQDVSLCQMNGDGHALISAMFKGGFRFWSPIFLPGKSRLSHSTYLEVRIVMPLLILGHDFAASRPPKKMTICMSVRHEHWNMHIISALPDSVDEAWATRHFGALDVPHGKKLQSNVAIDSLLINHSFMLTLCKTERVVGLPFTKSCLQFVGDKKSESQFSSPWTLELLVKTNYFEESDLRQSFWTLGICPCISSWYRQICKHFTVHSLGTFFANHFDPEVQIMMVIWVFFLASMAAYFRP